MNLKWKQEWPMGLSVRMKTYCACRNAERLITNNISILFECIYESIWSFEAETTIVPWNSEYVRCPISEGTYNAQHPDSIFGIIQGASREAVAKE